MYFSVVIPLFNKEISIKTTLESVLNQSYKNFEVIVVNDGSTDSSASVVEKFCDSRIRLINKENHGVSSARNRGIREARNEWIAFLDGDDLWKPNHLAEVVKMINLFPEERVFSTAYCLADGRKIHVWETDSNIFPIENFFRTSMRKSIINSSMGVVHKDCFKESGYFNEILTGWEDRDLWGRLARKFKVIKSKRDTVIIRSDAENRSHLSFNIYKHGLYHYDFNSATSDDEIRYYKCEISIWLRKWIKSGRFRLFFILYWRQRKHITFIDLVKRCS